ncbi:MAG: hypothetical protein FI707_11845 [SAR202 cluster bacterium]|jgi:hypothetical protein|nr:hypothetical protein [SAR202 cluster bacterium]MDP6798521.1 hypothetical protein [SAR202 cluster bacterium]MQG69471.1 hypothetical protein [SAR202 cluster bacterium]|tara:strand:+ start:2231 stop:3202 length:972 start_codon:yes stop_codon:yes gene_type:complete
MTAPRWRLAALAIVAALLAVAALACSADSESTQTDPPPTAEATAVVKQRRVDQTPLIKGPVSEDGLQAIFATPDLGVGRNRFAFVLTSAERLSSAPVATVSSYYIPVDGAAPELKQTALALFHPFPYVSRGLYATRLEFDRPGRWSIEASVPDEGEGPRSATLEFNVPESASAPALGSPAVRSDSKTNADVERPAQLATGSLHDPDLYRLTIAEAVDSGIPTVVVMASPAFCTNAVCGPQVEVLSQLKDEFRGQANFIHVDFYDNPEEIQGDLSRARLSPTVVEWNLPSGEWSFVIDRQGIVAGRFESFATLAELRTALKDVF